MAGCVRAHLRKYPEDPQRTAQFNNEGLTIEVLHQNHLQEADHIMGHHQIKDPHQMKICSAAEKEPQVAQESVRQMEGHLVAPACSDQEIIQAASDLAATPIVANQRIIQILNDQPAGHLVTQV